VPVASWNLAGLLLSLAYIGAAVYAHHVALARASTNFLPHCISKPSRVALFRSRHRCGTGMVLVLTPRGVYELRMNLAGEPTEVQAASASPEDVFLADVPLLSGCSAQSIHRSSKAPAPSFKTVFVVRPVSRDALSQRGRREAIVEILDLRFSADAARQAGIIHVSRSLRHGRRGDIARLVKA